RRLISTLFPYTTLFRSLRIMVYQGHKTLLLQPDDTALEEVIVTGYSDIKKRKNTTAYTKIDAEKIKQSGVASIEQMLEGQVPGRSEEHTSELQSRENLV